MTELIDGGNGKKRKTQNIQRGSSDRELHGHPRSLGAFAIAGNGARTIKIPIHRANCERGDPGRFALVSRGALIGGILRQLIAQSRNQAARRWDGIKRLEDDMKRLEDEIQELNHQADEWEQLLKTLESGSEGEELLKTLESGSEGSTDQI